MCGRAGEGEGTRMTACEGPYESGGKRHRVPPLVSAPTTDSTLLCRSTTAATPVNSHATAEVG